MAAVKTVDVAYTIQFQGNSKREFTESINNSPYYLYADSPADTGWKMKGPGYSFLRKEDGALFIAQYDTARGIVRFKKK